MPWKPELRPSRKWFSLDFSLPAFFFISSCKSNDANSSVSRVMTAGHSDHTEIRVEDGFSVPPIRDPIVYDQKYHDRSSFVAAVGDIFGDGFLPGPVAIDSIPGLASVAPLVLGET